MSLATNHYDVIVVGAGMSGLSAATQLVTAGKKILVLEGRDRVGGRMSPGDLLGQPVDLGAQWLEGVKNNPIAPLCQQLNITNVHARGKIRLFDSQGNKNSQKQYDKIEALAEKVFNKTESLVNNEEFEDSLGKAVRYVLAKKSLDPATSELVNWYLETEYGSEEAANLDDISLSGYWNSEDSFSGGYRLFPNSYAELAIKYAEGLPIQLNSAVKEINYSGSEVTVRCIDGNYSTDKIIITLPLGVLKNDSVQFTPELPVTKREAINSLGMGLANKVILRFPEVFWPTKTDYFGYSGSIAGKFCSWVNQYPYSGQAILSLWSHGQFAEQLEQQSDAECVSAATAVIKKIFGKKYQEPVASIVTRWRQDPFTGGSYSYLPPGSSSSSFDAIARPVGNKLFFAGEATEPVHTATVHGAYLSGQRAAAEVIDS